MLLYLIRHGKSRANENQLVTGTMDDVLVETGVFQVRALGGWIKTAGISGTRYICSPWMRARQTAEILWPSVRWEIDPRLGETVAGDVANFPLKKFLDKEPYFYKNNGNKYPGGESHHDLNERVSDWLKKLVRESVEGDKVVLVAHSGPISCILQHIVGIDMEKFPTFLPAHASLSIVEYPAQDSLPRLLAFSICPADIMPDAYIGRSLEKND